MSQENAFQFISKVLTDETLRVHVSAIGQDLEALRKLAARYGFEFTAQDFQNTIKASRQPSHTSAVAYYKPNDTPNR
jgi:predicted ribosomally synthesized peptide with nif11-like leader